MKLIKYLLHILLLKSNNVSNFLTKTAAFSCKLFAGVLIKKAQIFLVRR